MTLKKIQRKQGCTKFKTIKTNWNCRKWWKMRAHTETHSPTQYGLLGVPFE